MQSFIIHGRMRLPSVWLKCSFVFGLFGFVALAAVEFTAPNDWYMLGLVCGSALVYAIAILFLGLRDSAKRVLTDPFLSLIAVFSLHFLFGPLSLVIGPEDEAYYILYWYPTTAQDAVRVTSLNLIGLGMLLFAASFIDGLLIEKIVQPTIAFFIKIPTRRVFWLFFTIGFSATLWMFILDFTRFNDEIVSGSIIMLSQLISIAILVGIIYQGRGRKLLCGIAILIALTKSGMGFLLFSKSIILEPVLIIIVGFYLRWVSLKFLVVGFFILLLGLSLLSKPILMGRDMLQLSSDKSISTRLDILQSIFSVAPQTHDVQTSGWSRLCYTSQQVAAIDLYEQGQGGDDMKLLGWVFLPRILFPDKPIISRSGSKFNEKITGFDTSSSAMGLFLSGYYNLGWIGLFLVSILTGWILAIFAAISRAIIASGSVILLPVGLFSNYLALRVGGNFVVDYWGPFAMTIPPLIVMLFIMRMLRSVSGRIG